ncbi:chemotaxis protein CheA [Desulfallas thermosapovorans]|uniref:Chemotaxis protein CheA n=1 Tax=Desulfallas thermosapovorans DSM 6562 TaxID=1121431 RepID=A0A5S4ZRJ2_9FIRM|nr:chemotaxis protein CheA [Desulfallas thermosapovorans]TYO95534.1 two-component system chemotaxis sensor kinase CheA [Desulfallas thermosapovorans DSM 6562]
MFSDAEIAIFQEELEEKLQIINDNILLLEQQQVTPEVIQEIFRAAHTIKGSSAIMGYDKMTNLTHEIESLFDKIRSNRLSVNEELVDVLFEAMDTLTALKEEIVGDGVKNTDIDAVLNKIKQISGGNSNGVSARGDASAVFDTTSQDNLDNDSSGGNGANAAPAPAGRPPATQFDMEIDDATGDVIREADMRGYRAYGLHISIEPDCQMKEVRAFLLFETLEQAGEIIKTNPPAEELQTGHFEDNIDLIIVTQSDMDQVKNLALSVAEIRDVDIKMIELDDKPDQEGYPGGAPEPGQPAMQKQTPVTAAETVAGNAPLKADHNEKNSQTGKLEKKTIKTVRVDVEKLDTLMNLVGELVIDRTRLERFVEIFENNHGSDEMVDDILEISNHLGQVTTDLQDEIMKARMLPVAQVFNRFPRMVRDIAHKLGRDIEFIIEGKETELDRNVIEVIGDPLIHLLRNSIDHGIEPPEERQRVGKPSRGKLLLKASYSEGHIVITVEDDGRGIDAQKLKDKALRKGLVSKEQAARMSEREALDLIFLPGFSTVEDEKISDISGRGVGMDIVRTQIENINGTVEYKTAPGQGTVFTIKLPLTLAIIRALMVEHGDMTYAFPLTYVVETLKMKRTDIKNIRNAEVIVVRGQVYPLKRLEDILWNGAGHEDGEKIYVVIVGSGDRKLGVVVDRLIGEQEIVIKSLGSYLGQVEGLSGAAILGDGKVSLIVDVRSLVRSASSEEAFAYAAIN